MALGIAADGQKHALGLWDGSTENARVCQDLLASLQGRGRRTDRSLLVILDGSKALLNAVTAMFEPAALVHVNADFDRPLITEGVVLSSPTTCSPITDFAVR